MAERGSYKPVHGFSLLNVPQVQASRAGVAVFGALGDAASEASYQLEQRQREYEKTLLRQKRVDVLMGSLQSFTQYAKDHPNDPDKFTAKADAHRKAAVREYAKLDPDGASEIDYNLYADQLRMAAPIIKRNNDESHATNRAYVQSTYDNSLAFLAENDAEDADAYLRATAMLLDQFNAVGADGLKTVDPDDAHRILMNFSRDAAETRVRNTINSSENPAEYARRLQLTESTDGLDPVSVFAPVVDDQGNIRIENRPVRDVLGAQAADALAAHAFAVSNSREAGKEALTYDQLYAAKSTMSAAAAAAKEGSLSPGGFRKWREAAIASSQTPEELSTKMVEIDNEEKAMPARNAGYMANSQGQVDSIKDALGTGAGMEAQTAYDKSIADAQSNPVQYVRKVLSLSTGDNASEANTAYDTMIGAMEAGDFEAASAAYAKFEPAARGILGAKGFGYDTVLLESDAAAISSRINNLAVPEGESPSAAKAAHLRGLSVVFGADTGKVIKQMFPDSLDTNVLAMAQMDFAGDSANLNNALDARAEVKKALGDARISSINERVRGHDLVSGFVASFPANGMDFNVGAAWQDNISALAAWHVQRGMSEKEAVQTAAQSIIGANYHIAGNVRIPKRAELTEREIQSVEAATTPAFVFSLIQGIGDKIDYPSGKEVVSGFVQPDIAIQEFRKRVRWGAKLVTNKDESGVVLVDVSGNAVYARDDNGVLAPVEFGWKELPSVSRKFAPEPSVFQYQVGSS